MIAKKHPMYGAWHAMRQRCSNPKNEQYRNYGGRGIKVCSRWATFWNFLEDVGNRPEGYSLDRIDNDGNYEPGNVRWATPLQQSNNRRLPMLTLKNKSGEPGVHFCNRQRRWIVKHKGSYVGSFVELVDAIAARREKVHGC